MFKSAMLDWLLHSELPNSIGQLKHLRYLNLSRCRIKQLPQSVGFLFNLQTLILQSCEELTRLPQVIKNLQNLRVLDLTDTSNLQEMPIQIGNLKNLQTLTKFIVGKGIGSAVNIQDASNANLSDKHGLTALDLQWSLNPQNEEGEMHVLERLLPHKNLEKLRILFYGGKKFPSWLGMDNVQKVDVEFYGHGFPSVKPFPLLEILRFKDMLDWTCWSSPSQGNEDSWEEFPCLRELVVEDCPKLSRKLPSRLPSLLKLVIKRCPKLEGSSLSFPSLDELNIEDCNVELLGSILGLTSLTTVTARSRPKLQCLQNGVVQFPGALRVLVISNCNGLTSLWQKGAILLNIASLECLKITGCPQFVSLAEKEQGLSRGLDDLGSLNSYNLWKSPWGMHGFTSLVDLQIKSCPNLVFFPKTSFVPMLKNLKLKDCRALKSLPSGMMMLNCPLEELEIEDCPALTCFPSGRITTTLRRLRIGTVMI
ncbi:putative disease resistance RPP13-like protein 1 [Durio zibethinus]|uniref:Disease resistance RPP13-like protein 1 n=1 Tax=Durio zibethinus TaxID=66656 RepID=A0A6P6A3Z8_DURZI|nr:putative disease resistance RPP13-like protein 1 [Durio zibethinus]